MNGWQNRSVYNHRILPINIKNQRNTRWGGTRLPSQPLGGGGSRTSSSRAPPVRKQVWGQLRVQTGNPVSKTKQPFHPQGNQSPPHNLDGFQGHLIEWTKRSISKGHVVIPFMWCGWPNYREGEEVSGGQGSGLASREWCGFWGVITREDLCREGMILCSDCGGGCKSSHLWLNDTELCTQCVLSPDFNIPEIHSEEPLAENVQNFYRDISVWCFDGYFRTKKGLKVKYFACELAVIPSI